MVEVERPTAHSESSRSFIFLATVSQRPGAAAGEWAQSSGETERAGGPKPDGQGAVEAAVNISSSIFGTTDFAVGCELKKVISSNEQDEHFALLV
ncbi:MAG: hypothetical protein WBM57_16425, partial [Woeseiaceae bacterium]